MVAAPAMWNNPKLLPSRIQTLMRDADGRRRKWCQIYCGYYFVQHRYCGLKIQHGTGASDRLWGLRSGRWDRDNRRTAAPV